MLAIERRKNTIAVRGNNSRTEALNNGLFVSVCFSGLNHRHFSCSISFAPFHFALTFDISFALAQDLSAGYVYQCNVKTHKHNQTQTYGIFGHKEVMLCASVSVFGCDCNHFYHCRKIIIVFAEKKKRMRTRSHLFSATLRWFELGVFYTWQIVVLT